MHMAAFFSPAVASCASADGAKAWIDSDGGGGQEQFVHEGLGRALGTTFDYRGPLILIRPRFAIHGTPHEVPRFGKLRRHRRSDAGGQRRHHLAASAARQGRARHRQDDAGRGSRAGARHAAAAVAHQEHDQGAAGPVRIRRGEPAARQPAGRHRRLGAGSRHPQLHRQGRAVAGLHRRAAGGAADRRDRQGRHRVPERPAARDRPHGVLRLRDARTGARRAPAAGLHHVEQREGAARRLPAPLLLPLHPLSRRRYDAAASSACTFPI